MHSNFARRVICEIQNRDVLQSSEEICLHSLGSELVEINFGGGESVLLTKDAGLDFMFKFAEFMADAEK